MKFPTAALPCLLFFLTLAGPAHSAELGVFSVGADLGDVSRAGTSRYEASEQRYHLTPPLSGPAGNSAQVLTKAVRGDVVLQALLARESSAMRAGLVIRASGRPTGPELLLARNTDGTTTVRVRHGDEGPGEVIPFAAKTCDVFQITRKGPVFTLSAAVFGELLESHTVTLPDMPETADVGLYAANEKDPGDAVFHNVRLVRPARDGFIPYRDYIGSEMETLDLASGRRTVLFHAADSLQAPNWTPDGRHLIYNHNGRIYRHDLEAGRSQLVDTGEQTKNNNDHALSFDGQRLGISSGDVSTVYVLPITGGTPARVTTQNPSYLHGWSPDGGYLIYTGIRNREPDIYRIPVEGGAEQRLTDAPGLDDGSEYTPDGSLIYFNSERTGRMQLWRMKPDGSAQEQVTSDGFNNWFPHPSPDGRCIVFLSYGPDVAPGEHPFYRHVYLRRLDLSSGVISVVAYLYGGQGSINVNSWAPDSRRLAFVSNGDPVP